MTSFMKAQGAKQPTAFGSLLQSSAYGSAIPVIYGQTQSPLLAIWAANLRQGGSTKKFKQFKKGITAYIENIDFLLGHNPIMAVLRIWDNGTLLPLNFTSYATNSGADNTGIVLQIGDVSGAPDPNFYCVTAVTAVYSYSFPINDYGGQGPQTLTGTFEVPLWNELEQGPDPTAPSAWRNAPFCYRWEPSYGPYIYIDTQFGYGRVVNIYYAQIDTAATELDGKPPLLALEMAFEPQLGSGSEYADADLSAQQIIYPHFAGAGSSEIDLGAAGALPQLIPEVRGKWGIYPSGDGDFADMIEDIFKSGLAQAALQAEATPTFTQMERGLSSYNLPGCIQRKVAANAFGLGPIPYNLPTTAGNFLVVLASSDNTAATMSISDTGGNTWTALLPAGHGCQIWWAKAIGGPTIVNATGTTSAKEITLLEIGGVDTYDSVVVGTTSPISLTTTNQAGFAGFALAFAVNYATLGPVDPELPFWNPVVSGYTYLEQSVGISGSVYQLALDRVVRSPGTLTFAPPAGTPTYIALLSFKSSQPSNFPIPLGDFIDLPSLDQVRLQCRAYGLWGSLSLNSQSSASDWLKTLYFAADAAPVFLGNKLFSYPYAEQSFAGNGALYSAGTAAGPVANLNADNGDFVGNDGCPKLTTVDRINLPNVLQMQCLDRNANYNQIVVQQPDSASISLYGVRKADPVVNNAVQDPSIARALLGIQVRKNQYGGDVWDFTLSARWSLLSPMDLVTLTDSLQAISLVPVRITSMTEQDDGSLDCEAEPFVYGMYSPTALPTASPTPNPSGTNTPAGDVNAPVIFEPTPGLYPGLGGDQLWIVVSSSSLNYGGAQVMISTDGGASYTAAGPPLMGSAITGFLTASWPAAADPDSTNNLALNLAESNGVLQSYATAVENNFTYPCYVQSDGAGLEVAGVPVADGNPMTAQVAGTSIATLNTIEVAGTAVASSTASDGFGYELMTYAVATLTGTNLYTLMATGAGNFLRRSVLLAPNSGGPGVGHSAGARFAFLSPAGTGILKLAMPTVYVGQTIYFKILSFNQFGGALQGLADVPAYTYVPTGVPGAA